MNATGRIAAGVLVAGAFFAVAASVRGEPSGCSVAEDLIQEARALPSDSDCRLECLRQKSYFYGRAAALCPRNAGAHGALGDVYLATGRLRDAERTYRRALEADAGFRPALAGLGDVALLEGRWAEAAEHYRLGLPDAPAEPRAACGLDVARRSAAHEVLARAEVGRCLGGAGVRARGADAAPVPAARLALRVLFADGSAELDAQARAQLAEIAAALRGDPGSAGFVVEGHADAGERDVTALSAARAERVRAYLATQAGVATDRIGARSYAAAWPVAMGDSATERAANRRVELVRASGDGTASARAPLRIDAQVLAETAAGRLAPLARGQALESGARYAVRLSSPETVHAYVVQEDAVGQVTCLFPNPAFGDGRNPLTAKAELIVPGGGRLFRLDETVGRERLYVVGTRVPARDLEDLMTRVDAAGKRPEQREMILRIQSRGVAGIVGPDDELPILARALPGDDDAALMIIEFEHRARAAARAP